jgi:hypothetical protein
MWILVQGGRARRRTPMRLARPAQGGVEAEKFHVSWDLSAVTLCRVCVLLSGNRLQYPIVWIAPSRRTVACGCGVAPLGAGSAQPQAAVHRGGFCTQKLSEITFNQNVM